MAKGYGLDDDSDEDIVQFDQVYQDHIDGDADAPPTLSLSLDGHGDDHGNVHSDDEVMLDDDDDDYNHLHNDSSFAFENTFDGRDRPHSDKFPATLGLQPQRVHVMQTSFFHNDDDNDVGDVDTKRGIAPPKQHLPKLVHNTQHANHTEHDTQNSDIQPTPSQSPFRPPILRKFKHTDTIFPNNAIFHDENLALGRSFRVGFDNFDQFTHISSVSPTAVSFSSFSSPTSSIQSIEKSLALQLKHTTITFDEGAEIPAATTSHTLRFASFVDTFNLDDLSHEPSYWRLGRALFDEIDVRLPDDAPDTLRNRVMAVRRKEALSQWLQSTLSQVVESEMKHTDAEPIARIFTLLSGHQIARAAHLAASNGDYKLATLITQTPGDAQYRHDLTTQLQRWKECKADAQIDGGYRKVYGLLAGVVNNLDGNSSFDAADKAEEINVSEDLDWLRCFGLRLWYATLDEEGVSEAVSAYDTAHSDEDGRFVPTAAPPIAPHFHVHSHSTSKQEPIDALYSLLKLFIDPAYTLEKALEPIGFTSSKMDWRVSWHVYTILSRVLRVRDFGRFAVGLEEEEGVTSEEHSEEEKVVQGHSQKADGLTVSYAAQVEQMGLAAWSVFILLHIELDEMREWSVKESLTRNVAGYTAADEAFLTETLLVPATWLFRAKATHAQYKGDRYAQYKLLLAAEMHSEAHAVAVDVLAPEAIIRDDLALLRRLLEPLVTESVDGWASRGKLLWEYVDVVEKVPQMVLGGARETADAAERTHLRDMYRRLPILIKSLGGVWKGDSVQYQITLCEMTERLLNMERVLRGYMSTQRESQSDVMDPFYSSTSTHLLLTEGARLGLLENESYSVLKTPDVITNLSGRWWAIRGATVAIDTTLLTQRYYYGRVPHLEALARLVHDANAANVRLIGVFDGDGRLDQKGRERERRERTRAVQRSRLAGEEARLHRLVGFEAAFKAAVESKDYTRVCGYVDSVVIPRSPAQAQQLRDLEERRLYGSVQSHREVEAYTQTHLNHLKNSTNSAITRYSKRPPNSAVYSRVKDLLGAAGVPVITVDQSPKQLHEGEALASALVLRGLADYVLSEDTDVLIYGAKLIRDGGEGGIARVFDGTQLHHALHLTHTQLIDFALLAGTDFALTVPSVGPIRALDYIRKFGSVEEVLIQNTPLKQLIVDKHALSIDAFLGELRQARKVYETLPSTPHSIQFGVYNQDAVNSILHQDKIERGTKSWGEEDHHYKHLKEWGM
ncbi:hypothetical protein E3P98_00468 [Wallemia ichthyophaga]|nr:hypothetical protein E3P98_00468 [Wallemia ichthyophaga]